MSVPIDRWIWQGAPGHFICAERCRYHLATVVGPWLVSTVGEYYVKANDESPTPIGVERFYETMVFRAERARCIRDGPTGASCGERHMLSARNLDFAAANSRKEAQAAHMRMCRKWARKTATNGGK